MYARVGLLAVIIKSNSGYTYIVGPTPRYNVGPCCDSHANVGNFGKDEVEEDILDVLDICAKRF